MKKIFLFLSLIIAVVNLEGQTFAHFINRLNALPEDQRQAVADSFMNSGHPLPFIENDTLVHFVYNSAARSAAIEGDATGYTNKTMTHITGCNFWYITETYEADARLDYKFVINSSDFILDPKNPNICTGGYGPNSELRMPSYISPPEASVYSIIPHGTLKDTTCFSSFLGNSRHVRIYLPPGYPSGSSEYPVILFHDGLEFITMCNADNILDYLISKQLMVPVIAVFVPPVDREPEFIGKKMDKYTDFITLELMPAIDAKYKTSKNPSKRAMAGISNGGNISLYIGTKHPELFGNVAALSSSIINAISHTLSKGPKLNLAFYIDIGKYDIPELIPVAYKLREILKEKGYIYQFKEWHEGHSWGNWKDHLRLPLIQFFPGQ